MKRASKHVSRRAMLPLDREFNKLRIAHDIDLLVRAEEQSRQYGERLIAQADNLLVGIESLQQMLEDLDDVSFIETLSGTPVSIVEGVH